MITSDILGITMNPMFVINFTRQLFVNLYHLTVQLLLFFRTVHIHFMTSFSIKLEINILNCFFKVYRSAAGVLLLPCVHSPLKNQIGFAYLCISLWVSKIRYSLFMLRSKFCSFIRVFSTSFSHTRITVEIDTFVYSEGLV